MEIDNIKGINDMQSIKAIKLIMRRLSNGGIHMDRINSLCIRMLCHDATYRTKHSMHRLSEIFASMGSDQNQTAILYPFQFRMSIIPAYSGS